MSLNKHNSALCPACKCVLRWIRATRDTDGVLPTGMPVIPEVLDSYRSKTRYLESPETKSICDAKYQAMQVLDLFFNMRFNVRLEVSRSRTVFVTRFLVLLLAPPCIPPKESMPVFLFSVSDISVSVGEKGTFCRAR